MGKQEFIAKYQNKEISRWKITKRRETSRVGEFLLNQLNLILAEGRPALSYIKGERFSIN